MSSEQKILSTDGIPLEESLKQAERKNKIKAFLLVTPLLLFLIITYIVPIADMFSRSIDDKMVTNMLPKTYKAMEQWNGKELPPEEVFEAFYLDYKILVKNKTAGKLQTQLNYEKNGFKSVLKKLARKQKKFEEGNYKEQIMKVHKRWRNVEYWRAIKRRAPAYTYSKYLKGVDMYSNEDGKIVQVAEDRRIHRILWSRTLEVAFFVTLFCFLMAYPIAHLLATLPMKYSNLLMICVLLPFWTSLLVRTASWMILLQQQGIVNDFFVWIGLVADDNRPEMMYNKTGTYVAMTQILLPFETEEEAIAITNDTSYGLGNYLQTEDKEKAKRVARKVRAGTVYINGQATDTGMPFGGYKQSGNGREGGVWGFTEFLEVKAITGWN